MFISMDGECNIIKGSSLTISARSSQYILTARCQETNPIGRFAKSRTNVSAIPINHVVSLLISLKDGLGGGSRTRQSSACAAALPKLELTRTLLGPELLPHAVARLPRSRQLGHASRILCPLP